MNLASLETSRDPLPRGDPRARVTQTTRLEQGHFSRCIESWAKHGAQHSIGYCYL